MISNKVPKLESESFAGIAGNDKIKISLLFLALTEKSSYLVMHATRVTNDGFMVDFCSAFVHLFSQI